jgi:hypothetical protein
LAEAAAQGNVVVLDFTAEWCLNCKVLEHTVLHSSGVAALLNEDGVVPMKVDITGHNPQGKAKLQETGRLMIPLLLVLDPQGREVWKSDAYTAAQVIEAIHRARSPLPPVEDGPWRGEGQSYNARRKSKATTDGHRSTRIRGERELWQPNWGQPNGRGIGGR